MIFRIINFFPKWNAHALAGPAVSMASHPSSSFPPSKSIYCLLFLALSHFPSFMISSLWWCVSFSSPRHGCPPSCSLWALELPLTNETRAASLPGFCHPAVSFLKYKLIFIQWSSWANLIPFTEELITWGIKKVLREKHIWENMGVGGKRVKQKLNSVLRHSEKNKQKCPP